MSIQKIIQESIAGNPLEMKKALNEELRNRVAIALEAKINEIEMEDLEEGISPEDYSTHGVKSQFGGYRAHIKHKTKGHTMYLGSHGYDTAKKAKGEAEAYLKGYAEYGDQTANKNAHEYAKQHAMSGPSAKKNEEVEQIDELSKSTLGSYVKKASTDQYLKGQAVQYHTNKANDSKGSAFEKETKKKHMNAADTALRKASNRDTGIGRAIDRLTKE